jgi:hypothetical protein
MTESPILLSPEEKSEWEKGIQARAAIDILRMYLKQHSLDLFKNELGAAESVSNRVVYFLDEYLRLAGQAAGKYSILGGVVTCSTHPGFAPMVGSIVTYPARIGT